MKNLFKLIGDVFFSPQSVFVILRCLASLAVGALLIFKQALALKVLMYFLLALPLALAIIFLLGAVNDKVYRKFYVFCAIAAAACPLVLYLTSKRDLAVWGAGVWALLAAVEMLLEVFRGRGDFVTRLVNLAGGIMSGTVGYLFLTGGTGLFITSAWSGFYFFALAIFCFAGINWGGKSRDKQG